MNKKKLVVVLAALVAVLTIAIGGTLAYFTDTEKATNVMTVGKVDINLEEYMFTEDGEKVPFDSDEAMVMYPMTDEQGMESKNKIVDVYNDSPSDVYIRTLVAFEKMTTEKTFDGNRIHYRAFETNNYADQGVYGVDWQNSYYGELEINGVMYDVHVFDTVDGAKIPSGARVQSLQAVWLDKNVANEDVVNGLGEDGKMDILVVAQGVQTENFADYDAAFAATFELTDENIISWFEAVDSAVINDR